MTTSTPTRRAALALTASLALAACAGVPLSSLPRLMSLPDQLLNASPAEVMLAVQTEPIATPPANAEATFDIEVKPGESSDFAPIERHLPMRLATAEQPEGLPRAERGRHWQVYSFGPDSQTELQHLQAFFKQQQGRHQGASLGVGITQAGLAADDPRLANVVWQSWLQTSRASGFFKLWSGTLGDLKAQASDARGNR